MLIPQKALSRAKSRMALDSPTRRSLVTAMLRDTAESATAVVGAGRVVILWEEPGDASAAADVPGLATGPMDLNAVLEFGVRHVRSIEGEASVVAVPGDLPALDPVELARFLARAEEHQRAFLADASGIGTTILAARHPAPLKPRYGGMSARAHSASGAHPMDPTGLDSARADVDDLTALDRALALGCGHHTLTTCTCLGLAPELTR